MQETGTEKNHNFWPINHCPKNTQKHIACLKPLQNVDTHSEKDKYPSIESNEEVSNEPNNKSPDLNKEINRKDFFFMKYNILEKRKC